MDSVVICLVFHSVILIAAIHAVSSLSQKAEDDWYVKVFIFKIAELYCKKHRVVPSTSTPKESIK